MIGRVFQPERGGYARISGVDGSQVGESFAIRPLSRRERNWNVKGEIS